MTFHFEQLTRDQLNIPGEAKNPTITPYFTYMEVDNVAQSENQKKLVKDLRPVCQLRIAGDRYYSPVVPVDSVWRTDGVNQITFAELYATQYRAFLNSEEQIADGTPLEELRPYGISPAQLSMCRAAKIYTVEALYHLEGPNAKNLGMHINSLKPMAQRFMESRGSVHAQSKEIEALKQQIEELRGAVIPPVESSPEEIDEALYEAMTEQELRDFIIEKTGTKPDGRLGHSALVNLAKGM